MSNPVLLEEVCDSAHLGIDEGGIVPEVEVTNNNVLVPASLIRLDVAQRVELLRICLDPLVNDGNRRFVLFSKELPIWFTQVTASYMIYIEASCT